MEATGHSLSPETLARGGWRWPSASMLCETRKGTIVVMWNGGPSEAESGNRIFYIRRERGESRWSDPRRLENRQIDFGTIYQPRRKPDAPILAGYWLGAPKGSQTRMIVSHDDGKTWSEPMEYPTTTDPFWQDPPARGHYRWSMSPPVEFPDRTLWFASEQRHRWPAIVVVPPDNHTGRGRTPWGSIHPEVFIRGRGVHGDFLVLSPDYKHVLYITRQSGNYVTRDGGRTWAPAPRVPKGGAGVGALSLDVEGGPCQRWHLVAGCEHPRRDGLQVWLSSKPLEPSSWRRVLVLHKGMPAEDAGPSMVQSPFDRKVHLLFTGRGEARRS